MKTLAPRSLQRGITLLESLVAIVVMALGILGILGVQMRTLTNTQTSLYRAQAIRLIEDLNERMMANPNAFLNTNNYLTTWAEEPEVNTQCNDAACDSTNLSQFDLAQWKTQVASTLPNGNASVFISDDEASDDNRRQLGVMVSWRENESSQDDDYRTPLDASTGGGAGDEKSCPADQTCHLQFLPVMARCAPYFAGSNVQTFCPGS